jgi:purine nucleoside phosphorylase
MVASVALIRGSGYWGLTSLTVGYSEKTKFLNPNDPNHKSTVINY